MIDAMVQSSSVTVFAVAVVVGLGYYMYTVRDQNEKQKRLNPKRREPIPRHKLGQGLNDALSRNWLKIHREYNPKGAIEKRHI